MFRLFRRKPDPTEAARVLGSRGAQSRIDKAKAAKRARVDEMLREMGRPAIDWSRFA